MSTADNSVRFTVLGRSQTKGSHRSVRNRVIDSNRAAAGWQAEIAHAARRAYAGKNPEREVIRGPVAVHISFYFARPRGHFGTGRNAGMIRAGAPRHMATMPDLDKLARCTLDALTGAVIKDDGQVCLLNLFKCYGEPERLEAEVHEL